MLGFGGIWERLVVWGGGLERLLGFGSGFSSFIMELYSWPTDSMKLGSWFGWVISEGWNWGSMEW